MSHIHNSSARDALLFWLNSAFREGKDQIMSLVSLADGVELMDILKKVDPDFIDYTPDRTDTTRNLLTVRKGLLSAFHRDGAETLEAQAKKLDVHTIADKRDQNEIAEFIVLLMCLAVTGPRQEDYVNQINSLSQTNAAVYQTIGMLAGSRINPEPEDEQEPEEDEMTDQDRILSLEAALAKTHADLDKARKDHADTMTRLESLKIHQEELVEEAQRLQEENYYFKESQTRGTSDALQIRDLKLRIEEQDATILNLEEKLQVLEDAHNKLTKEAAPLRDKAERTLKLEDEVQELRYQNAELEKKSNAAENYRKKILQQRDLQVEVTGLKTINQELHDKMDYQEQLLRELPRLQEVEARFHTMLQSYETQISDLTDHKKSLEHYIRDADRKVELLEEQRSHDEKYISDMREQLQATSSHAVGSASQSGVNLEQELEDGEGMGGESASVPLSLELSRLKAENQVLRGNMASASEATQLRVELEALENTKNRLQEKNNQLFEDHAVAQEHIRTLMEGMTGDGSAAFATMRREKEEAARELSKAKKQLEGLQAQISDRDREILSARADLAAVEKDSVSALEELKSTDQLIASSARNDLATLQQRYADLQEEHKAQQEQLVRAFIAKEKLAQDLEEAKDAQEKSQDKSTNEKVEKLRARTKHYKEQLEKAEQEKYELQRRLKSLQAGDAAAAEKNTKDQIIKNLQRENAMIATAWYDLTSRLQSNHVVLQRRHDAPKSWLNKQRQMVNATPRR